MEIEWCSDNDGSIIIYQETIDALLRFTSAAIKAKVLKDMKKKAAAVHNRSMKEDSARIAANNPKSRAWLHPGVVGEKDNWNIKIMNWTLSFLKCIITIYQLLILKYFLTKKHFKIYTNLH